jgi:hypothetical protein
MSPDDLIRTYGIQQLYHFTDTRNLPSIRAHGLLSFSELRGRGIIPPAPGGNEWSREEDERRGMDRFVHLCLFNEHPMEYVARTKGHIQSTVFLEISPSVLHIPGVLFTNGVAIKSGVEPMELEQAIATLDWEVIYRRTDWKDPAIQERRRAAKKYEVLIPEHVPVALITRGLR